MEIKYRIQLPDLLRHFNLPMIAAECGVAEGNFSVDLLNKGIEKLYSIDAWETLNQTGDGNSPQQWHDFNFNTASKRLSEFGDRSIILRGLTSEMAKEVPDNSLGLVYLDGDHSYEGVMTDLISWYPKLISGGILSGHDFLNESYKVKEAVQDFCNQHGYEWHVIPELKSEDAGFYFIKK